MRLVKAHIRDYRSIIDSTVFEIEREKTILVGPNEAGKTALLQALQQLNPPKDVRKFEALRDYPRSKYNDISSKRVNAKDIVVVTGYFTLETEDTEGLPEGFENCTYLFSRHLDNSYTHRLDNAPPRQTYGKLKKDLLRLASHMEQNVPQPTPPAEGQPPSPPPPSPINRLEELTKAWSDSTPIEKRNAEAICSWLKQNLHLVSEANDTESKRLDDLLSKCEDRHSKALEHLHSRLPVFVLFNNYFRTRPLIHLEHLANRSETKVLDDDQYDYGNLCLLKLLGFSARELSNLGKAPDPTQGDANALKTYRDQLDSRTYQLNAASVRLTKEINEVWIPDKDRVTADRLRINVDGQYLKVVVEDDLGVEIELDQRSEGFQWLVSFFVVFFAEAEDKHENCILLLDEPGLNLHGLKQRDFRNTISKLAVKNQTIYTTHSPFLVGPDELDLVRVVEMTKRETGTKVHTTVTATDPAALLPLQEALGYDLAQSLFGQKRNLVLEGLTDYWYLDGTAQLLREAGIVELNEQISLVPANTAGKVVYYATILHAQKLKVAALLDSDSAGDQAAHQENLVHTLGNKAILRTKDAYCGPVAKPEVEDLLRDTLIAVAKNELGWDVTAAAAKQPERPIVDVFSSEISDFSKYKLAKAYLRWTRGQTAASLSPDEQSQWVKLIESINKALK